MIEKIHIENFKSIEKLTLFLGRINVFIGENGCGKSNILEAICMASAANSNKLDNEFLASRGIRLTEPVFMRSAFDKTKSKEPIFIEIEDKKNNQVSFSVQNDNKAYAKWHSKYYIKGSCVKSVNEFTDNLVGDNKKRIFDFVKEIQEFEQQEIHKLFPDFIIYSPENSALRAFHREGQVEPLGINGEGLFKLLKVLSTQNKLAEVKEYLKCMGWFEDFSINNNELREDTIHVRDRYIDESLGYFTQNSTNEGFLFILFYLCLFISEDTPKFFAIDNIDASLNPKLCSDLMEILVSIATRYNKQAIFTTHNASILDGINLHDDDQRLFVISRTRTGRTKIERIQKPEIEAREEPVKLSTAFTRGYIGGLSRGF